MSSSSSSDLSSPPFIPVAGVPNFRDLGGYACASTPGTSLRRNYLFRCALLSNITPEGKTTLTSADGLNVHTLYDLRSEPEISAVLAANPTALTIPTLTRHSTPVYANQDYSPLALAAKYDMYTSPPSATEAYSPGFVRAYRHIAQHAGPAYTAILTHVRDRPGEPLVFHCTAGKDRTGVLAALVLRLCGVDDRVIAWEYALTQRGLGAWREVVVGRLMDGGGFPRAGAGGAVKGDGGDGDAGAEERQKMTREQAERVVGSRAKDMAVWLSEVLDGEFGGARKYLRDYCGFDDGDLDRIRDNLLVREEPVLPPGGWEGGVGR